MNALSSLSRTLNRMRAVKSQVIESAQAVEVQRVSTLQLAAANARKRVARLHRRADAWIAGAMLGAMSTAANAQVSVDANFTGVSNFLQAFQDFMTGPFGRAAVVISIIAAFTTWVFAPRDGIFGPILRVVVAGIAIINATAWMGVLQA